MTNAIITREYKGDVFTFREDGYFNMTEAAKKFGKQLQHFWNSPDTQKYRAALQLVISSESDEFPADHISKPGRNGGTWGHPKLATFFARWLDPAFAVWCDMVIDDILNKKAELTITKPEESMAMKVPQSFPEALRLAAELAEKNEKLALENQDLTHERDGLSSVVGSKMHTVGRFARTIPKINSLAIKSDLQRLGYLYRNGGTYRIYRQYEHLFVEKFNNQYGSIDIFVTEKGKTLIASLADQKKLTMKKAYAA